MSVESDWVRDFLNGVFKLCTVYVGRITVNYKLDRMGRV